MSGTNITAKRWGDKRAPSECPREVRLGGQRSSPAGPGNASFRFPQTQVPLSGKRNQNQAQWACPVHRLGGLSKVTAMAPSPLIPQPGVLLQGVLLCAGLWSHRGKPNTAASHGRSWHCLCVQVISHLASLPPRSPPCRPQGGKWAECIVRSHCSCHIWGGVSKKQ